jgi:molecular chaperone Hsp33
MKHSEQLDTRLWLAADAQACAGLLLQRMPGESAPSGTAERSEAADAAWTHCATLADTLDKEELRTTDSDTLIRRLFWEDDLLVFPEQTVRWHCPCSRERVAGMLRTLGRQEVEDILAEQGHVHIACNFCGQPYDFDAVDCAALFTGGADTLQAPGSDTLH